MRSFSKIFRDDGNDFDDPSAEQVITRSWIIREDAGHGLQVAHVAVDYAEDRHDGGLVGGDAVEVAYGRTPAADVFDLDYPFFLSRRLRM